MKRNIVILVFSLMILCGFRWTGKLTEYPVDPKSTKQFFEAQFTGGKAVNLINAQPSLIDFLIAREIQGTRSIITTDIDESLSTGDMDMHGHDVDDNVHELVGNLNSWTSTAVCLTKKALREKGFRITQKAEKRLLIFITPKFDMIAYPFLSRCIVFLKVKTGDGYTQEYEGNNISFDSLENIFGGAVKLAVEKLLIDDNILAYLGAPQASNSINSTPTKTAFQDKKSLSERKAWSVSEVAEAFGVPETKIRRWIIDGQLKATKLGSTWLIPDSEVERVSNPGKKPVRKSRDLSREKRSYDEDPQGWLQKLKHLKAIGLLSQKEYAEEEKKLKEEGLIY